jgi:hypothetical protein
MPSLLLMLGSAVVPASVHVHAGSGRERAPVGGAVLVVHRSRRPRAAPRVLARQDQDGTPR